MMRKGSSSKSINKIYCSILGKKSIAQSARASIINGQRLHISSDIVGEKKVIYETISKTSSKTSEKLRSQKKKERKCRD